MGDLRSLPEDLQRQARLAPTGEVMWRADAIGAVLDAISSGGGTILGLDLRSHDPHKISEVPLHSFDPALTTHGSEPVDARQKAEAAMRRAEDVGWLADWPWVLVTWT